MKEAFTFHNLKKLYANVRMFGALQTGGMVLISLLGRGVESLRAYQWRFDERYGTDTEGFVYSSEQGVSEKDFSEGANFYAPTNPATLKHVLSNLPIRHKEFEFIDVGSGKGRVLLVASHYPFARITGIELSEPLANISRENIAKYSLNARKVQRCKRVEVITTNIRDYPIPDGNLVFFFYHPFTGKVFEDCMRHIHEAALSRPDRQIYLAYVNPWVNKPWLEESGYFVQIREVQVANRSSCWSLWKATTNTLSAASLASK